MTHGTASYPSFLQECPWKEWPEVLTFWLVEQLPPHFLPHHCRLQVQGAVTKEEVSF